MGLYRRIRKTKDKAVSRRNVPEHEVTDMINFIKALPTLLGAARSIKNLKSPSTVVGGTIATTGVVVGSEVIQIDPTSTAGIVYNLVMAAIAAYGLFKDVQKNSEG